LAPAERAALETKLHADRAAMNEHAGNPSTGEALPAKEAPNITENITQGPEATRTENQPDLSTGVPMAAEYLLRGATGGARGDIVQEIIAIVRQVASGLPPERPDSLDDGLPGG
jgi:hypothetical protein